MPGDDERDPRGPQEQPGNPADAGDELRGEELWATCLDGLYQLRLETTADQRTGRLTLTHIVTDMVLLDELVPLPAGAMYGLAGRELRRWRKQGWQAIARYRKPPFGSTPVTEVQEQQHEQEAHDLNNAQQEEPHD